MKIVVMVACGFVALGLGVTAIASVIVGAAKKMPVPQQWTEDSL